MDDHIPIGWWKFKTPTSFEKYKSEEPAIIYLFTKKITFEEFIEFINVQNKKVFTEEHFCLLFGLIDEIFRNRQFSEDEIQKIYNAFESLIINGVRKHYEDLIKSGTAFGDFRIKELYCYDRLILAVAIQNIEMAKNKFFRLIEDWHDYDESFLIALAGRIAEKIKAKDPIIAIDFLRGLRKYNYSSDWNKELETLISE